jgi:hypothetical protein
MKREKIQREQIEEILNNHYPEKIRSLKNYSVACKIIEKINEKNRNNIKEQLEEFLNL